jgi:iron-regulated transporter 1
MRFSSVSYMSCLNRETLIADLPVLFGPLISVAQQAFHGNAPSGSVVAIWCILLLTITCSILLGLANTTLEVAIERDW